MATRLTHLPNFDAKQDERAQKEKLCMPRWLVRRGVNVPLVTTTLLVGHDSGLRRDRTGGRRQLVYGSTSLQLYDTKTPCNKNNT